ncbi:MAG: hypothetical protein C4288_22830 [Leptolyngbya sp. ERB_1_1]
MLKTFLLPTFSFLLIGLSACSQSSNAGKPESSTAVAVSPTTTTQQPATTPSKTSSTNLTPLFSRIWRVTKAPSTPASGSIYVFLPNGTLLQTSCTEPYRIAGWTVDKAAPRVLRVTEDGRLAYTATITQLSDTTLQLQRTLVRSNEKQSLTLTAVQQEFVCPDLPR